MEELAGNAEISFEGDLSALGLLGLPDASTGETASLKRNTQWPKCDLVVLPLTASTVPGIIKALGGTIPRRILHIQIAKDEKLEFGAYDNFHPESLYVGASLSQTFMNSLISEGMLERKQMQESTPSA